MRFGLFLMPEPFPWSNWTLSYDLKLEEIVVAERFGYDEVWIGEHHTGAYENIPAPDIFIAKASALTHRMPWIIGSPEGCITQVRELDENVGGFGSLLFNSREWVTIDRWHRSLELFARYVSPHFRARADQRFRRELADDAMGG